MLFGIYPIYPVWVGITLCLGYYNSYNINSTPIRQDLRAHFQAVIWHEALANLIQAESIKGIITVIII